MIALNKKIMKKTTTLIIMLLLLSGALYQPANAQWSPAGKMGSGPIDGCFSFSINGKGYAGGGANGNKFYQYDTTTNAWTLKGNAPGNKIRGWAFSFVVNGKAYVVGGDTTGSFTECAEVWMYDPDSNSWTQKADFAGGPRDAGFSFVINDTAYIGCGFDGAGVWNDMWRYNSMTDSWTALNAVPFGNMLFPATFVLNNKGYVATGEVNTVSSAYEVNTLWMYNPAGDTWTQKADFPGTARQTSFSFVLNGMAYVGGGQAGYVNVYTDMWWYDAITDSWSAAGNTPSSYPAWSTSFAIGNTGYMGTGVYFGTSSLIGTDSFYKYKPVVASAPELATNAIEAGVFPNPATDYINITGTINNKDVTVLDVTGRVVKTFSAGSKQQLYIGDLEPGIYLLKLKTGVKTANICVIKE